MSSEEDRARILAYSSTDFAALLTPLSAGIEVPGWPPGRLLEYFILRAFRDSGAEVTWPYYVNQDGQIIEQVDGALYVGAIHAIVEAKDYDSAVDFEPIAKLQSRLLRRPALAIACLFSRSGFTAPAKTLARYTFPQTILLWEGLELKRAFEEDRLVDGLLMKMKYAVERGAPDYNILEVMDA
ncbi:MAG: restriction endonuclease [Deltaproteobacteria bacterium]|nr:restriction endonuclease [Deltaproteobacteria bacterium]